MLASLGTFQHMWIAREAGPGTTMSKCQDGSTWTPKGMQLNFRVYYFGCSKGGSVLFNGKETVMVLTWIILK